MIVGRGWNKYNFGQMLEWIEAGPPADKVEFFEKQPQSFLCGVFSTKGAASLLFTQLLSADAMVRLSAWFGADNIVALSLLIGVA